MKYHNEEVFTIPNLLSFYRLITFPLVLYFICINKETLFFMFLSVDLITDVLDGFIARRFNLQTEIGAKLDSLADIGMYILAIIGVINFKLNVLSPYLISFSIFIGVFILPKIIAYIRFRKFPSLHLFSSKIGGYFQGFFFLSLFLFKFSTLFYYIMIILGIISFIEQTIIVLIVTELKTNVKGLYWILKKR